MSHRTGSQSVKKSQLELFTLLRKKLKTLSTFSTKEAIDYVFPLMPNKSMGSIHDTCVVKTDASSYLQINPDKCLHVV